MDIKFGRMKKAYGCFSNFYSCRVEYDGLVYKNSEAAWQSLKTMNPDLRKSFCKLGGLRAKQLGRTIHLRDDWEQVKVELMIDVCYQKFKQNPRLAEILLATGDELLIEDTTGWHDNFWGNCECEKCKDICGKNWLGISLMKVREKLRSEAC